MFVLANEASCLRRASLVESMGEYIGDSTMRPGSELGGEIVCVVFGDEINRSEFLEKVGPGDDRALELFVDQIFGDCLNPRTGCCVIGEPENEDREGLPWLERDKGGRLEGTVVCECEGDLSYRSLVSFDGSKEP